MNVAELLELGTKPIRPDAPGGDPARDTPEFELLQTEIRKLEAPDQPTVNWEAVTRAATAIASTRSKDLLVAAYLSVALYETEGFPGLVVGLQILRAYADQFWETCFPEIKRLRGRSAAFEWLNDRGARAIERAQRKPSPDSVNQCNDLVNELDDKLGALLDSMPPLGELRRALGEVQSRIPQPSAAPATPAAGAPAAAAGPTDAEPVPTGPPPITAVGSPEDLELVLEEVGRLGDLCATFLRGAEPSDPLGYRLSRVLVWRHMREVPPNEDGVTVLPDFDVAILDQLEQAFGAGQYADVLQQTETQFWSSPLWLDLSRHAVRALEAQGAEFMPAADAVVYEMSAMLKRVPDLVKLKTSGGIPLADDATKKWIAKRVMVGAPIDLGGSAEPVAGARPRGGEGFAEAQREARKLGRGGKLAQALRRLTEGAQHADRLEDRTTWKLEAARVCMQAGRFEMALAQLESLDDELRRATIEDWDPAFCAEILRDLLRCRQQVAQSADQPPTELARSRELMGRLVRLDVVSALELNGRE